jgi:AbiV family abortive infection protein
MKADAPQSAAETMAIRTDGRSHFLLITNSVFDARITSIVANESDNPKDDLSRIRSNAARLLRDAKLLSDHERHASAFALAVLGLEEIGKSILLKWDLSKYSSGHVYKQVAVSSLLMADTVMREAQTPRRGMIYPAEVGRPPSPTALERIIRTAMDSEAGRFNQSVDAKALDKMKLFAFYYDGVLEGAGFHPNHFSYADVEPIFKMCFSALNEMDDNLTVQAGKAIFLMKSRRLSKRGATADLMR